MDLFLGFILHFLWNTNAAAKIFVGGCFTVFCVLCFGNIYWCDILEIYTGMVPKFSLCYC